MKLFDVYPLQNITPVKALGAKVWDSEGIEYLDLYGGHAVISIGHSHPKYVSAISEQVSKLGFYSNSIQNPLQVELAEKLGKQSGYDDYNLFLCNSGAEAVENAVKLASFTTGKSKVISFKKGFHGRTSLAVSITDNPKVVAPVNDNHNRVILDIEDFESIENELSKGDVCSVIIEGIQGIAGIYEPSEKFLVHVSQLCSKHGTLLILDEIQSGYGRSGKFFAHQFTDVKPDIITMAKGMGNGFPIGGILISPKLEPWHGMLGTTFGGSHLACAAAIAVLDVLEEEQQVSNTAVIGEYLISELKKLNVVEVRGRGLMIGIELDSPIKNVRSTLLMKHKIFTGVSSNPNVLRLLPPLCLTMEQANQFLSAFKDALAKVKA